MTNEEYLELVKKLNYYSKEYYENGNSPISDEEYDTLYKMLEDYERSEPANKVSISPTNKVGYETGSSAKIEHEFPMLSLDNSYNEDDIKKFIKRIDNLGFEDIVYTVEQKIDGVAISLKYEKGKLVYGATRGDGKVGENISKAVGSIKNIPLKINRKFSLILRGEVYMPLRNFLKLNEEREKNGEEPFSNPRNSAAGSLKLLDIEEIKRRGLMCIIYTIESGSKNKDSIEDNILLEELGFTATKIVKCKGVEDILETVHKIDEDRDKLAYGIDGAVIKVSSYKIREEAGYGIKSPKWAIAYKYKARQVKTKVLGVKFQVGRTGSITPVAELEEVLIAGTMVKNATLHNSAEIERLGIKIGDTVFVEKGGEIIPKIVEADKTLRDGREIEIEIPDRCPICKTKLEKKRDYIKMVCPNYWCKNRLIQRLIHFCSRDCMDIKGLGVRIINKLVSDGVLKYFADIYNLDKNYFTNKDGWGDKSVENLMKEILSSKSKPFSTVLYSLGINKVGKRKAEIMSAKYGSMDKILSLSVEELQSIELMGKNNGEDIHAEMQRESILEEIVKLKEAGLNFEMIKNDDVEYKYSNKTFLITGTTIEPRRKLEEYIKSNGGRMLSNVSKNLNFLIVGSNPGSKLEKAKKINTKIISEEDLKTKDSEVFDELV